MRMSGGDEKDPLATIKKINCASLPPCNKHVNPPSFVRTLRHFGIVENLRPGDENLRHLTVTSI